MSFQFPKSYPIVLENPSHGSKIEDLHKQVFGPGRFARAAFRVREQSLADDRFCFVALKDECLVGSVRLTPILIGEGRAFLLGPLCVLPDLQGCGIGKALVQTGLEAVEASDALPVFLVGDEAYYRPLGFEKASGHITMPGPVDPARLLVCWGKQTVPDKALYQGGIVGGWG